MNLCAREEVREGEIDGCDCLPWLEPMVPMIRAALVTCETHNRERGLRGRA